MGGGSIQNMLVTLKNNQKQLQGRRNRAFFRRERDVYRLNLLFKISNVYLTDKIQRDRVRERAIIQNIKKRQSIEKWFSVVTQLFVTMMIFFCFVSILSRTTSVRIKRELLIPFGYEVEDLYQKNMDIGMKKLKGRDYFYAAGNFEKALKAYPGDIYAEYYAAKSYCKLCYYDKNGCERAKTMVKALAVQYPSLNSVINLNRRYLSKR